MPAQSASRLPRVPKPTSTRASRSGKRLVTTAENVSGCGGAEDDRVIGNS